MSNASSFEQLGKLLIELGWITPAQLQEALAQSRTLSLPLGMVLANRGFVSLNEIKAAVEAQSGVRDGLINPVLAHMALTMVGWSSVTFRTALKFLGLPSSRENDAYKLGNLLLQGNCISEIDRYRALDVAEFTALPLGQTLLLQHLITPACLKMALEVQALVRNQAMSWDDAVRSMSLTYSVPLEAPANRTVPLLPELRLGELLVLANVVSRDDIKMALEVAQTNRRHLGEVLSIFALIAPSILTAALELQRMLRRGELTIDECVSALGQAYHQNLPLPQALQNFRRKKRFSADHLTVAKFLQLVGMMTEKDIDVASEACMDNSVILTKILKINDPADQFAIRTAARLKLLVKTQALTLEAACFAFHHCLEHRMDVDQFLRDSGWYQEVEPGSNVFVSPSGYVAVV